MWSADRATPVRLCSLASRWLNPEPRPSARCDIGIWFHVVAMSQWSGTSVLCFHAFKSAWYMSEDGVSLPFVYSVLSRLHGTYSAGDLYPSLMTIISCLPVLNTFLGIVCGANHELCAWSVAQVPKRCVALHHRCYPESVFDLSIST